MNTSEQITELLPALYAARLAFPAITRNQEGVSKRTGRKYRYADLNALLDAVVPVLGTHGLLLVQSLEDGEPGLLRVVTTLYHVKTSQWMSAGISAERPENMQDFGSTCTYLKRYALQAHFGLSTEEDDDAASLNGSRKAEKPTAVENARPNVPFNGNGHTPAPEPDASAEHPTEGHIAALANLALTECREDKEVYYQRIRTTMGLKSSASVAPKLLTRTMSMAQYMTLFEYYRRLEAQLAKSQQEATHGTASPDTPATQPAAAPTMEKPPVDPSPAEPSSSAPAPDPGDAAERDRVRLRAEVAAWDLRVPAEEVEHVIQRNPYSKARALLWKCRRQDTAA